MLLGRGSLSDEDLILQVAEGAIETDRLRLLASLSRLLRLMDGLLSGKETGESFVAKFSEQWLLLQNWEADPSLESEFDELNNYYSEIQLFSSLSDARYEEPLLFGLDRLKELTQTAYERLLQKWHLSLTSRSASST